jgi:hypothetical protein
MWLCILIASCNGQNNVRKESTEATSNKTSLKTNVQKEQLVNSYFNETPPDVIPKVFAPGIVSSSDNYEFKIAFTPDRKEIYFTRGVGTGSKERQILFARLTEDGWTNPEVAQFCKNNYMDEYPTISPDGKKLFFGSNRPLPASWNRKTASYIYNLWIVERIGDGWGEPYPINPEANKGICINYIDNQGAIYYNTNFPRIAKAEYKIGLFTKPVELNTPVPTTECFFASDNSYVIYSSSHPGYGKLDLFVSSVAPDGAWGKPVNLGKNINTAASESTAVISPDGKYLFYSSGGDIYWVSAKIIEELKPME